MRGADLVQRLGIPSNQASFHLAQLAKYGLIIEAPSHARDKRDRVWELADPDGLTIRATAIAAVPGGKAAIALWRQHAASDAHRFVDDAYGPVRPGTHRSVTDQPMRLSQEEADEFAAELSEVIARWSTRGRGLGDGRDTYRLFQVLQPDRPAED